MKGRSKGGQRGVGGCCGGGEAIRDGEKRCQISPGLPGIKAVRGAGGMGAPHLYGSILNTTLSGLFEPNGESPSTPSL